MDFDKLFTEYLQNWFAENKDGMTPDEMEEKMPEVYEEWKNIPCKELDGQSPKEFFDSIDDPNKLVRMLIEETGNNRNPSSLLLDRITELDCSAQLNDIVSGDYSAEAKIEAINLLIETSCVPPVEDCIKLLANKDTDEGLRELVVEVFESMANEVKSYLFAMIPYADDELKGLIAEILVNADKDERTYNLLVELFLSGKNTSLYAGLLGKYGDERGATVLYKAMDTCNYADFMEISNAIEQLGGTVDDEYRDFSDDPYYKALKNLK